MNYTKTIREFCRQNPGKIFDVSYMGTTYFTMVPYKTMLKILNRLEIEGLVLKQLNQEIICDNLKYLRIVNNYSGKYLADLIDIDFSTYKSYESGERLIRIDVLYGLAQIYGYTIEQLLKKKLNYI